MALQGRPRLQSRSSRQGGFTLVETTVSIGIMAFILGFVGYLIFMGSINAYNVHEQVMAQTSASNAGERLVSLLREATYFEPHPDDRPDDPTESMETTLTRVLFAVPNGPGVTRSAICFHPGSDSPRVEPHIQYYENAADVSFSGTPPIPQGRPTRSFHHVRKFEIMFESDFRLQMNIHYEYRGFAMVFVRPEVPMLGAFITDVIAKNHYLPYGPNGHDYSYSYEDPLTTLPVTL